MIRLKLDPEFWLWCLLTLAVGTAFTLRYASARSEVVVSEPPPVENAESEVSERAIDLVIDRDAERLILYKDGQRVAEHKVITPYEPAARQTGFYVCVGGDKNAPLGLRGSLFPSLEEALSVLHGSDPARAIAAYAERGTIGIQARDTSWEGSAPEQTFEVSTESLYEIWAMCHGGSVVQVVP